MSFHSFCDGDPASFWQLADGYGPVERLTLAEEGSGHIPDSFSPTGERCVYARSGHWQVPEQAFQDLEVTDDLRFASR